jgi:hypothetical protein
MEKTGSREALVKGSSVPFVKSTKASPSVLKKVRSKEVLPKTGSALSLKKTGSNKSSTIKSGSQELLARNKSIIELNKSKTSLTEKSKDLESRGSLRSPLNQSEAVEVNEQPDGNVLETVSA